MSFGRRRKRSFYRGLIKAWLLWLVHMRPSPLILAAFLPSPLPLPRSLGNVHGTNEGWNPEALCLGQPGPFIVYMI